MFSNSRKKDKSGRANTKIFSKKIFWVIGNIITADRRKSFLCDRGGKFCFYCKLVQKHLTKPFNKDTIIMVMTKTRKVYMHTHKNQRLIKVGNRGFKVATFSRLTS